ncbi:hypothetical protein [Paenibacillus gansuensis]|uniref:DUF5668 domain-containing protein n=1 Tax=Paenibacillus gansuensis TaxID=306542 RepID=A0ABW5PHJ4_9BACL
MNPRSLFGIVLMLVGVFLFVNNGAEFGTGDVFAYFWPSIFVLPLAFFFHWLYFGVTGRKGVGLLVPGGILLTVGVVCQISMLFDNWEYTWPGFILAPAVGLLELYWFGGRNKYLLIPINILGAVSLVFFGIFSISTVINQLTGQPFIAILMILVGGLALIGGGRKQEM